MSRDRAVAAWIFADLDLHRGTWPIIGLATDWRREEWPMPVFVHKGLDLDIDGEKFPGQVELRYYDDDNPALHTHKKIVVGNIAKKALKKHEKDRLLGSAVVAGLLDDAL